MPENPPVLPTSNLALAQALPSAAISCSGRSSGDRETERDVKMAVRTGNDRNNEINGTRGNDKLSGRGGHDELDGNAGSDRLYGNAGHDELDGDQGNDL